MHLLGENKEITRVFGLVRKAQQRGVNKWNLKAPSEYTMGTGHVKFYYTRLGYILKRYHELTQEMTSRGYKPNPISDEDLLQGIDKKHWMGDYEPTEGALKINRQRIAERLKDMDKSL
tara:strand:- start:20300 stop:20653 length:354 start_codon:yes stop_codon:yes gene_type:complete